jgi:hypothetical protein
VSIQSAAYAADAAALLDSNSLVGLLAPQKAGKRSCWIDSLRRDWIASAAKAVTAVTAG